MRPTDPDESREALVAIESFRRLHLNEQYWHLTPPSSGQPKARCACFRLPLMSNVSRRMPLLSIPAALGMAAVAVCGWSIVHTTKQRGALSKLRSAALAQFRQAHTASQDNS